MSNSRLNLFWLIIFGCTMPLGVVISTNLARNSFEKVKLRDQTIRVKGYAEEPITSDRAEWSASIVVRNADRTEGYKKLETQRTRLVEFLDQNGFKGSAVVSYPVQIQALYEQNEKGSRTNKIEMYHLEQSFQIASEKVGSIADVARKASDLISEGIELNAGAPSYLYTKLDVMKLKMLADATKNARERAEALVSNSNGSLGPIRSANQGVFQITPAFSTEVTDSGQNDTTSIQKVMKAVVTIEYAIQ